MNRVLYALDKQLAIRINMIDGGGLRNAIPRESTAHFSITGEHETDLKSAVENLASNLKQEYASTDPGLDLQLKAIEDFDFVLPTQTQFSILRAIYACPSGIYRMSPEVKDLVQTSNNLARVLVKDGKLEVLNLTRGSVESEKLDEANAIAATFELIGAQIEFGGSYPGWAPNPKSRLTETMVNIYRERYDSEPHVNACHAGLECGILSTNYPGMEMISFGPNILGAHSPDERAQISSVKKFWGFLLETLDRL